MIIMKNTRFLLQFLKHWPYDIEICKLHVKFPHYILRYVDISNCFQ